MASKNNQYFFDFRLDDIRVDSLSSSNVGSYRDPRKLHENPNPKRITTTYTRDNTENPFQFSQEKQQVDQRFVQSASKTALDFILNSQEISQPSLQSSFFPQQQLQQQEMSSQQQQQLVLQQQQQLLLRSELRLEEQNERNEIEEELGSNVFKPFCCSVCGYSCKNSGSLQTHLRTHTGEKPFVCNLCGRSFRQRAHVDAHKRIHSNEKPFKCEVCDYACRNSGSLNTHKSIHKEKKFSCSRCEFSTKWKSALIVHLKRHEN